jgi:hypothetical protein
VSDFCQSFGGVLCGVAAASAAVWWSDVFVGPIPPGVLAHRCGVMAVLAGGAAVALLLLGLRHDE